MRKPLKKPEPSKNASTLTPVAKKASKVVKHPSFVSTKYFGRMRLLMNAMSRFSMQSMAKLVSLL